MATLYLIRHGRTEGNLEKRYIGVTDEALCEQGIRELKERRAQGVYPVLRAGDILAVSPMKRCVETAKLLYPDRDAVVVPEFREIDFGRFEGKNYQELTGDTQYQEWIDSGGKLPFPEGEGRDEFVQRCVSGMQALWRQCQGTLVFIVHGGTIQAILSELGDGDFYDFMCDNGAGYMCRLEEGAGGRICEIRPL